MRKNDERVSIGYYLKVSFKGRHQNVHHRAEAEGQRCPFEARLRGV